MTEWPLDLVAMPTWAIALAFVVAAVAIWRAGYRLARAAEGIARNTGLGSAFVGMVLLGIATSLPELGTVATAGARARPEIAINNLLGGIAFQATLLAVADAAYRKGPLTRAASQPIVIVQGLLLVVLLCAAAFVILVEEPFGLWGVGVGSFSLFAMYVAALWVVHALDARWTPARHDRALDGEDAHDEVVPEASTRRLATAFLVASLVVLVAGYVAARTGEELAERTHIGGSFLGATLLAAATSLPELSTTLAAVSIGAPNLAIANIFGTNLADAGLLVVADAFYREGFALDAGGAFSVVAALLGIVLTVVFLIGILARDRPAPFRIGLDSYAAVAIYAAGVWALSRMG